MGLKDRLGRLEQQVLTDSIVLRDGSQYIITSAEERFEAFVAALDGRPHPLLEILPEIDLEASPQERDMVALIKTFRNTAE